MSCKNNLSLWGKIKHVLSALRRFFLTAVLINVTPPTSVNEPFSCDILSHHETGIKSSGPTAAETSQESLQTLPHSTFKHIGTYDRSIQLTCMKQRNIRKVCTNLALTFNLHPVLGIIVLWAILTGHKRQVCCWNNNIAPHRPDISTSLLLTI